jgi:hypothetical protein
MGRRSYLKKRALVIVESCLFCRYFCGGIDVGDFSGAIDLFPVEA